MRTSFRIKLVSIFVIEVICCMAVMTVASKLFLKPVFIGNTMMNMKSYCQELEEEYKSNRAGITESIEEINLSYGINAVIINKNSNRIYSDSGENLYHDYMGTKPYERWIKKYKEANIDNDEAHIRLSRNYEDTIKRLICVKEIERNQYIVMYKTIKGIDQDTSIVTVFILIMGIIVAIVGAITWSRATKPYTSQIKKMSIITSKMQKLNFDEKIDYRSSDELGLLAESIDGMSDELKKSIDSLKEDVERRKMLIRDISHEIKTPITTVKGYAEMIQATYTEDPEVQKFCSVMVEECDAIDNLVKEMLEMSRIESDDYECDFADVSAEEIHSALLSRVRIEYPDTDISVETEDCPLRVNGRLIERAVMNYVKNAVRYRTPGTEIIVKGERRGNSYVFSVSNEGTAIGDDEKRHMWDAFYKKDKSRTRDGGHGVGLAIVKRIAELHSGSVSVESRNGRNVFMLIVPC